MYKQDLTLAVVKWSICATSTFEFKASLVITGLCLHCMEIRPLILIEPDSKKSHSGGRWAGMHISVAEPLQIPCVTVEKLILSVSNAILGL